MSFHDLDEVIGKKTKLLLFTFTMGLGVAVFLSSITHTAFKSRHTPKLRIEETNRASRGGIVTEDNVCIAYSQKLYKAMVNTHNIDPDKRELFIKLFSIYSGVPEKKVRRRLGKEGNVILSFAIDANRAKYLKTLARKMRRLKIFIPWKTPDKRIIKYGLSITESGESRHFPYRDMFAPVIGYTQKSEENGYTRPAGIKGIEKYYNSRLAPLQNGIKKGERDIGGTIILNGDSFARPPIDGATVHLNIKASFQKLIEQMLDKEKKAHLAKEITVVVMESDTGKILTVASSNRYNPARIRRRDLPWLNVTATEYTYEPGSVLKPIVFALLLEKHKVNPMEPIKTYNGRFKLGRKIITDEHKAAWLSAENVIVFSSNIGIAQLAQRLDGVDFVEGLKSFGFVRRTGIDLPYEHTGIMPHVMQMNHEIYKATVAYGYGIRATLMQLVRAYNVFNHKGRTVHPRIVGKITDPAGERIDRPAENDESPVISPATAYTMNKILKKVVAEGTGTKAQIEGLTIGGKTGTAHIAAQKGGYGRRYNSTFIGFANDKTRRYTIGVLVREAKKPYHYFAAMSAVPVFKKVVEIMVSQGYLEPDPSLGHYPKKKKRH